MFCASQPGTSEERYYISEYSSGERAAGLHLPALAFAHEARSERDMASCCGTPCVLSPSTWRQHRQQQQQQQQQQDRSGGSSSLTPSSGDSSCRKGLKGLMALPHYLQLAVPVPLMPAQPDASAAAQQYTSAAGGDVELALEAAAGWATGTAAAAAAAASSCEDDASDKDSEHRRSVDAADAAGSAATVLGRVGALNQA
jgi:hypothetical protein